MWWQRPVSKVVKYALLLLASLIIGLLYAVFVDTLAEIEISGLPQWNVVRRAHAPTVGWKVFNQTGYGFSFKYPPDWTVEATINNTNKTIKFTTLDAYNIELINPIAGFGLEGWLFEEAKVINGVGDLSFVRKIGTRGTDKLYYATTPLDQGEGSNSVLVVTEKDKLSTKLLSQTTNLMDRVLETFQFAK